MLSHQGKKGISFGLVRYLLFRTHNIAVLQMNLSGLIISEPGRNKKRKTEDNQQDEGI
jgi:hypothetical protein